jgi:photosystem II stability/assembly factor-like uncharacterized protein
MKQFTPLLVLVLVLLSSAVYPQQDIKITFDQNSGFWRPNDEYYDNANDGSAFTWQFVQTPTTAQVLDVFFVDSLFGWAGHTANGCMRTTDSGFNWILTTFNDTNFSTSYGGVYFINQNTGWAVGGAVQIRKTTNGGANWFKQYAPPVAGVNNGVYFFNENTGIIIGRKNIQFNAFAAKTTNSGANWFELNAYPPAGNNELFDQYWFNSNTGWICGYDVLLKTTDGGQNFTNLYSNIPPSGNGHIAILAVNFVNSQTGWLGAANLERNNIYKTTNGGANWFFQQNPVSLNGWNQINDVRFITQDSGWAVHGTPGTGAIMFTSNAGTNWVMDNTQYSWYDCLYNYQHSKIWCGGSSGRMWYSIINEPVGISENNNSVSSFVLNQNYPNPFNPVTKISYELRNKTYVTLKVFNVLGNMLKLLVNKVQKSGRYEIEFDGTRLPSGVYFYEIAAGEYSDTKKMVLLK